MQGILTIQMKYIREDPSITVYLGGLHMAILRGCYIRSVKKKIKVRHAEIGEFEKGGKKV